MGIYSEKTHVAYPAKLHDGWVYCTWWNGLVVPYRIRATLDTEGLELETEDQSFVASRIYTPALPKEPDFWLEPPPVELGEKVWLAFWKPATLGPSWERFRASVVLNGGEPQPCAAYGETCYKAATLLAKVLAARAGVEVAFAKVQSNTGTWWSECTERAPNANTVGSLLVD